MNLKNVRAKIYLLIPVFWMIMCTLSIMHFTTDVKTIMKFKLFDILMLCWGLNSILIATQKVVAKNDKKGYLDYCFGIFFLYIFYTTQHF